MSRMAATGIATIMLFASAATARADAPLLTAEEAMANYREKTSVAREDCARNGEGDEIVVCGHDIGPSQRLPLSGERRPREGPRMATGEVAAASAAPIRTGSCGTLATDRCGGGLPVFGAAMLVAKAIGKIVEGDE